MYVAGAEQLQLQLQLLAVLLCELLSHRKKPRARRFSNSPMSGDLSASMSVAGTLYTLPLQQQRKGTHAPHTVGHLLSSSMCLAPCRRN